MNDFIERVSKLGIEHLIGVPKLGMEDVIESVSEMCSDMDFFFRNQRPVITEKRKYLLMILEKISEITKRCKASFDFKQGLDWLNTTEPLSLQKHLKGKVIVLDFFTYCCINCMHILPDLKRLEEEFSVEDGLVVIGVHNAKFTNEQKTENIESALRRYDVTHPVVNDDCHGLWETLGIMCWPTLFILGPNSEPLLILQGEGHYETLRIFIDESIKFFKKSGSLTSNPIPQLTITEKFTAASLLKYPGKISINSNGRLLCISDTAHHRILIVSPSGEVVHEIGGLEPGLVDGSFSAARFFSPQGTVFYNNVIYVADTENHAIRKVDLDSKKVVTLFENKDKLCSPWDVYVVDEILFIAMAGTHQIWAYFFQDIKKWKGFVHEKGRYCEVIGSGKEENRNNQYPLRCGLAQPSGLASDGSNLFIADSESSTIRIVNLTTGSVTNLAGGTIDPMNLFSFGDRDGVGMDAKLQHPLGVTWSEYDDHIYVADSYNHKIKKISKQSKQCTTVDIPKLNEPGGLCSFGENLYIADTNSHVIRILHLPTGNIKEMKIKYKKNADVTSGSLETYEINLNAEGGKVYINVNLSLPNGVTLTPEAPSAWTINYGRTEVMNSGTFSLTPKWDLSFDEEELAEAKEHGIRVSCRLYICHGGKCYIRSPQFVIRLSLSKDGPRQAQSTISYHIKEDFSSL